MASKGLLNDFLIKDSSLEGLDITLTQALLLFVINLQATQSDFDELLLKSFIGYNASRETPIKYFLLPDGKDAVSRLFVEGRSTSKEVISDVRVIKLQEVLTSLFPTGRKPGTNNYWRGNSTNVQFKLKIFLKKYGNFTDEVIIKAVKKYLRTFERNETVMRTLPYLIEKDGNSDLMTYIENDSEEEEGGDKAWLTTLK